MSRSFLHPVTLSSSTRPWIEDMEADIVADEQRRFGGGGEDDDDDDSDGVGGGRRRAGDGR